MDYRKDLERYSYTSEETIKYSNETFLVKDEVKTVLDDIETRVNEIKNILEPIHGLDVIDEVKVLVGSLVNDLY